MKKCTKCGEVKPLDDYYNMKASGDGKTPRCKACLYVSRGPRKKGDTLLCNMCKVRYPRSEMASKSRRCRTCDAARRHTRRGAEANGSVLRFIRKIMPVCVKCGSDRDLQYDHIVPIALGGTGHWTNYQTLCGPCNNKKNATVADYRTFTWTFTPYEKEEAK